MSAVIQDSLGSSRIWPFLQSKEKKVKSALIRVKLSFFTPPILLGADRFKVEQLRKMSKVIKLMAYYDLFP